MEGKSVVSDELKFLEIRTKFKAAQEHVDCSGVKLVTSAHEHDLILVASKDKSVKAITSDQILNKNTGQISFTLQLTFIPTLISVSRNGFSSILLVAGYNEISRFPVIELFDIADRCSIGKLELNDLANVRIVDYAWHPTHYESIVVLCTDKGHLLVIGFNRKDKRAALVYKDQQYGVLTCCWSPKGKNLAIGMMNGKILRLEYEMSKSSFTFKEVKNSTLTFVHDNITPEHQVVKIRWIVKTSLVCAHAKPNASCPDTVYSVTSVKPGKPYKYWTNLCFEKSDSYYNVHLINLVNFIICSTSSSGEAAVLSSGGNGDAEANEPNNWNSLVIDEEGGRIELPLDENNQETFCRGVTVVPRTTTLVFHTSNGLLCPYQAIHSKGPLRVPELQELEPCPLVIPKGVEAAPITVARPVQEAPLMIPKAVEKCSPVIPKTVVEQKELFKIGEDIAALKKKIDLKVFLNILDLRTQFEEIQDIHKTHREVLDSVKADIESLDLGMLENLYLIEYIKSRSGIDGASKRRSLEPRVAEKVESCRQKLKHISGKLRDLNAHVDVLWEDYVRRRNAGNRDRRLSSLDMIYKTLANNQKIINFLKKKSAHLSELPPPPKPAQVNCDTARFELDPNRMRALREFLASRDTVPVRRHTVSRLKQA